MTGYIFEAGSLTLKPVQGSMGHKTRGCPRKDDSPSLGPDRPSQMEADQEVPTNPWTKLEITVLCFSKFYISGVIETFRETY